MTQQKYTVFTIRAENEVPVFVGVTKNSAESRLHNMAIHARNTAGPQYSQQISIWLREQYDNFKMPAYKVEGIFDNKDDANALGAELMFSYSETLLNQRGIAGATVRRQFKKLD